MIVIGLPSMRILRSIAVYTPEAWQGWGFGVGNDILEGGVDTQQHAARIHTFRTDPWDSSHQDRRG